MKEATGELNMTVITLIAIAAIGALFYLFVWPMIQLVIANQTCKTYGTNYKAVKVSVADVNGGATTNVYQCCPGGTKGDPNCITIDDGNNTQQTTE